MTEVARYATPEGDVVVWRNPTVSYGVQWFVDAPGHQREQHGTRRAALRSAAGFVRSLTPPPPPFDFMAAWDKVRAYA
jgi:hypothetical protein